MPMARTVRVSPDPERLAEDAADWLCRRASESSGRFSIALSGGSTPKRLYQLLAEPERAASFPWELVHWFWGDERFVPPDHADSNERMVREALLSQVPVPAENIHPVPTVGLTPAEAATAYERTLRDFHGADALSAEKPLFDIVLLGLGDDGHTASLFPGTDALEEQTAWTAAVIGAKPEPRITLTYPALAASRDVVFLVAGKAKAAMVKAIFAGEDYPAARVATLGRMTWMLDQAASGEHATD